MDTVGRPVLILKLSNMVDEIGGEFSVQYKMAPFAAFREPALLIGRMLLLFAGAMAWMRLDLSISKDVKWAGEQQKARAAAALQHILLLISGAPNCCGDSTPTPLSSKPQAGCPAS